MAHSMAHRGPDDECVWTDGECGLAFRRLAIIDPDPRSSQPLHLGALHLVFNGEIYNYRELRRELRLRGHAFYTEGDGEVLLHAWEEWGERALDRVNGMFALAVWDGARRRLTLASDPFGEKPLYYLRSGRQLVFGSEIRAIRVAVPGAWAPDEATLGRFLARGFPPCPQDSFFRGVRRLPAAHVLRFEAGSVEVERYWHPRAVDVPSRYEEAVAQMRDVLVDSVRLRLRSDVPIGTSLSGGVDSAAVVSLTGEIARGSCRDAFTASFLGFERDEWGYAEAASRAAGIRQHHRIEPSARDLERDLDALVRDQEEPFGSASMYAQWRVYRAAREAGVVVLLDGQGGDELFGGYEHTIGHVLRAQGTLPVLRALAQGGWQRAPTLATLAAGALPGALKPGVRRRIGTSPYVSAQVAEEAAHFEPPVPAFATAEPPLRRELVSQAFVTSLPSLLRYADRDSMAHGVEVRMPLLDRRLAELALSLPAEFLYRDGRTKRVLRDSVRDSVPAVVLDRERKVGFELPQTRWLAQPPLRDRIAATLLDPSARSRGLYDAKAIEADALAGVWRDDAAIWRALSVELWLQAHATDGPHRPTAARRLPAVDGRVPTP
jgi:asparagine synthase (glutamine-hydrolysing)